MLSGPEPALRRLLDDARRCCPSWAPLAGAVVQHHVSQAGVQYHGRPARVYLHHPIRVARWLMLMSTPADPVALTVALLHNMVEHQAEYPFCEVPEPDRETVLRSVRMLTVDRSRESDPGYLRDYYAAIEAGGRNLAAIKCLDKLDNILVLCLLPPSGAKDRYLEQVHRHVVPLAVRTDHELSTFMEACLNTPALTAHDGQFAEQWSRA